MPTIAVCDDNAAHIDRIEAFLDDFQDGHPTSYRFELHRFTSAVEFLASLERGKRYDIIFLDIIMPILNGIQVAQEIRARDTVVKIVFLSSSPEFALASYKVKAFTYLLKTCTKDDFFATMADLMKELAAPPAESILVRCNAGLLKVYLHTIEHLEVVDKTITYALHESARIVTSGKLAEHEKPLLAHGNFIKPHRSFIVNLDYVASFGKNCLITTGGSTIPVPKTMNAQIKQLYLDYSFSEKMHKT